MQIYDTAVNMICHNSLSEFTGEFVAAVMASLEYNKHIKHRAIFLSDVCDEYTNALYEEVEEKYRNETPDPITEEDQELFDEGMQEAYSDALDVIGHYVEEITEILCRLDITFIDDLHSGLFFFNSPQTDLLQCDYEVYVTSSYFCEDELRRFPPALRIEMGWN